MDQTQFLYATLIALIAGLTLVSCIAKEGRVLNVDTMTTRIILVLRAMGRLRRRAPRRRRTLMGAVRYMLPPLIPSIHLCYRAMGLQVPTLAHEYSCSALRHTLLSSRGHPRHSTSCHQKNVIALPKTPKHLANSHPSMTLPPWISALSYPHTTKPSVFHRCSHPPSSTLHHSPNAPLRSSS